MIDLKTYQKYIKETHKYPSEFGIVYPVLAICGESGEIAEKVKKIYRDHNGIISEKDRTAIKKELGDVLSYIVGTANYLDLSLEEIFEVNYQKLIKREATNTISGSGDDREEKTID